MRSGPLARKVRRQRRRSYVKASGLFGHRPSARKVQIGQRHIRAGLRQHERRRTSDARGGASDERLRIPQVSHRDVIPGLPSSLCGDGACRFRVRGKCFGGADKFNRRNHSGGRRDCQERIFD